MIRVQRNGPGRAVILHRRRQRGTPRVQALDRAGNAVDFVWESFRAVVVQHETDHLNGALYVDRADPKTLTFLREYDRHVPLAARILDQGKAVLGS